MNEELEVNELPLLPTFLNRQNGGRADAGGGLVFPQYMYGGDEAHLNVHLAKGQAAKVNLILQRLGLEQVVT